MVCLLAVLAAAVVSASVAVILVIQAVNAEDSRGDPFLWTCPNCGATRNYTVHAGIPGADDLPDDWTWIFCNSCGVRVRAFFE